MHTYRSPAKINLFLRILNKRPDGYHALASLMQTIDLCDYLHIRPASSDSFTCSNRVLPTDERNLVVKASKAFRQCVISKIASPKTFHVHLEKRIPFQAGLGGGSSNAATMLWALNHLHDQPLTHQELITLAASIGSDVPFFLSRGTALVTGRGEYVDEKPPLPSTKVWIIKPKEGLSTPLIYSKLDLSKVAQTPPETLLNSFYQEYSSKYQCINDLESPAFEVLPRLAKIKQELQSQNDTQAAMCGSGSALFCLGNHRPASFENTRCFEAQFINRSDTEWF